MLDGCTTEGGTRVYDFLFLQYLMKVNSPVKLCYGAPLTLKNFRACHTLCIIFMEARDCTKSLHITRTYCLFAMGKSKSHHGRLGVSSWHAVES